MTNKTQMQRVEQLPLISAPATNDCADAGAFYQRQLAATTSTKKKANLSRVWRALEQMRKAKKRSYSLRAVADVVATFDDPAPTYQAMLNKGGQHFRDLIRAYDLQHGLRESANDPRDDDILSALHDPVLQMRYMNLLSLLKNMEQGERLLKQQLERQAQTPQERALRVDEYLVVCTTVDAFAIKEFIASIDAHPHLSFASDGALSEGAAAGNRPRKLAPAGFEQALRKIADRHTV